MAKKKVCPWKGAIGLTLVQILVILDPCDNREEQRIHSFQLGSSFTRRVITMFLGGDYHDRDNPHRWGVSHGKPLVLTTLVCIQKEGRQQSSSRRGLRTSMDD
jgi:hypothetical protein